MTGTLRVLMYHRVLDGAAARTCNPSLLSATPAAFDAQMRHVARHYRVLSPHDVLAHLRSGRSLPPRALLVTFDDGYRDFGEVAWPALRRYRLPATVFVPTAHPDRPDRVFWWDRLHAAFTATRRTRLDTPCGAFEIATPRSRREALRSLQRFIKLLPHAQAMQLVGELCRELGEEAPPRSEVLGWNELRELAADGATIAAHTRTHAALTRLSIEGARAEIRLSVEDLRREIGNVPPVFAYPFGDHDDRIVRLVREEGFEMALTCRDGHSRWPGADLLRLPRIGITSRTGAMVLRARLTTAGSYLDRWRHREEGLSRNGPATPAAPRVLPRLGPAPSTGARPVKVAYIMSRFPKLSETFVLNEIVACAAHGIPVEVYPLLRQRQQVAHPEADEWVRRAHFEPFLSPAIVRANLRTVREQPRAYFRLVGEVLRETWRSPNFFVGALGIFPKVVRFARQMRDQGVTHIHAHFATHPALAAFIVHRLTGIPFSFTAHGSDLHVDRRMLDTKLSAAAFAVTVSEFNRDLIARECGEQARSKVRVIHCGVDPGVFKPRHADAPDATSFRIVCVASFEEVKGHRYLIEACRVLQARGVRFECHLVGDGPLRRDVERRVAAAGVEDRVCFHGGQPRPTVARLLAQSDAAVLASHPTRGGKREGIPVALMEAMASGLPVVATAISGIPELVQPGLTGFLVPSGDPGALADALQRLAGDPDLRARMGRAGRARVVQAFNLRTNRSALLRLFTSSAGAWREGDSQTASSRAVAS